MRQARALETLLLNIPLFLADQADKRMGIGLCAVVRMLEAFWNQQSIAAKIPTSKNTPPAANRCPTERFPFSRLF